MNKDEEFVINCHEEFVGGKGILKYIIWGSPYNLL